MQVKKEIARRAEVFAECGGIAEQENNHGLAVRYYKEALVCLGIVTGANEVLRQECLATCGNKIEAIKLVRSRRGMTLKDAKEFVDGFWENNS